MKRLNLAAFVLFLGTAMMQGQSARTWVASFGSDSNACSNRATPCATFAGALAQTAGGGEIDVVDAGSYGTVTIAQSLTIDGGNQIASVLVSSGNGIVVAGGANDIVTLRNLQVNGSNSGVHGIRFLSGKNLSIERCRVYNFTQNGIDIEVSAASTVQIADTTVKNSGNDGIFATSTSGLVRVGVFNSQIMVSGNNGVEANSNGFVTVHRSLIAASAGSGAIANGSPCGSAGIDNSDIVDGNNAVTSNNNCWLNIGHSHLGYNNTGTAYNQAGGNILVWTRGVANASNGTNIVHDHNSVGSAQYGTEQ